MPSADAPRDAIAPADDWQRRARQYERDFEYFRAYDTAVQGLAEHPGDLALKYRAVLALAKSEATPQARKKYQEFGLDRIGDADIAAHGARLVTDIASLDARLLKDMALSATKSEQPARFAAAASAYQQIYDRTHDYYPGINAATLHLLSDDTATARKIAREIIALIDLAKIGDDDRYYALATLIEAHAVLGEIERAKALAPEAYAAGAHEGTALASTLRQLRLLLGVTGQDQTWLSTLSPSSIIHFAGHIFASSTPVDDRRDPMETDLAVVIARELASANVRSGYGSLAAGADILFAEALLARGASLHVTLPFNREEFAEISVRPAGEHWVERFERCLAAARVVRYATEDRYLGDDQLFGYCTELSMGMAVLAARRGETAVRQIVAWDGSDGGGAAGTAADAARWRRTGLPQTVIPFARPKGRLRAPSTHVHPIPRVACAMLFADVHNYSKLGDAQLPSFVGTVLAELASVIGTAWRPLRYVNTWGDALYIVFEDAGSAAHCALALQEKMAALDLAALGLPADLQLRIGGHFGPAFQGEDPVLKRSAYFGAHVSRAARIEPVTPEGCVYVTEPFAAVLALHHGGEFACEYVGVTAAAKNYGSMPMFLLRRR